MWSTRSTRRRPTTASPSRVLPHSSVLSACASSLTTNPTLFAIDRPYFDPAADGAHQYVIKGTGFGAAWRAPTREAPTLREPISWPGGPTQITFTVPASLIPGPYQLSITNTASGLATVNGLTFHRLSPTSGTNANTYLRRTDVYEVSPASVTDNAGARTYTPQHDAWDTATDTPAGFSGTPKGGGSVSGGRAIQRAIEAARQSAGSGTNARPKLVVIYPNTAPNYAPHNPFAAYFENVVLHSKVMLQGVGPGGAVDHRHRVRARTSTPRSSGRPRRWFLREATRTPPTVATPTIGAPSPLLCPVQVQARQTSPRVRASWPSPNRRPSTAAPAPRRHCSGLASTVCS